MITDKLQKQIIEAMKVKDAVRVSTLRMLSSELKNARIEKGSDLTDEEELKVVKKEAKKRKDAIEAYEKAGRSELADSEKKELNILQKFLPQEMSEEEVEKMVDEIISEGGYNSLSQMGPLIGKVMSEAKGNADGKKVSEIVRKKLSELHV